MAGHSKWAQIKRAKGANDVKKGKIFSKLSREITIAARLGGGDPDLNPRLRMVLLKCKSSNMPADNVDRAIKKGTGADGTTEYYDLTYELYGPSGVALLVEASSDNKNRTAADVRHAVTKFGGNIATSGSVTRLFQRKGQIMISREAAPEDELMELALESGAEDFKAEPDYYEILTEPADFETVHKALEDRGIDLESAEVTQLPLLTVPLSDPKDIESFNKLVNALEDYDDVKDVYTNADIPSS